ncbi:MAG: hypothetical protein V9G04_07170 [Nocardioides sp.]
MMIRAMSLILASMTLAACGNATVVEEVPSARTSTDASPAASVSYQVTQEDADFEHPAGVLLQLGGGHTEELRPWSWCMKGGCADGWRGDGSKLFSVGSPDHVDFTFALPGFEFEATFAEPGEGRCLRRVPGKVETLGEHSFRVYPAGPVSDWVIDLFGRGPGGDVSASFRWATPTAGTVPGNATGTASVLAAHDGSLDSYGIELGITGLPDTPKRASATIEVRSDSGKSVILDVGRAKRDCWSKGDVSWHQQKPATEAVALGGKSFTYVVRVDLDGETYTGTARWPEDTNEQITPGVPLTWDPPLPAYDGSKL